MTPLLRTFDVLEPSAHDSCKQVPPNLLLFVCFLFTHLCHLALVVGVRPGEEYAQAPARINCGCADVVNLQSWKDQGDTLARFSFVFT